jgi:hypothetical protein
MSKHSQNGLSVAALQAALVASSIESQQNTNSQATPGARRPVLRVSSSSTVAGWVGAQFGASASYTHQQCECFNGMYIQVLQQQRVVGCSSYSWLLF